MKTPIPFDCNSLVFNVSQGSDASKWWPKLNQIIALSCQVYPSPENRIATVLAHLSLVQPETIKKAADGKTIIEPSWDQIGDLTLRKFVNGRFSYPISIIKIAQMIFLCSEMYLPDGSIKEGIDSRVSKGINNLDRSNAFFLFTIKIGRTKHTCVTYNRYLPTISLFWPETIIGRQQNNDKHFIHPLCLVPVHLIGVTTPQGYMNAVNRMFFGTKGVHRDNGWYTEEQAVEGIKKAFCELFLTKMINRLAPATKDAFLPFEGSGMSPDEYVRKTHATASSLPPFEGIIFTPERILGLNLPAFVINDYKNAIEKANSDAAKSGKGYTAESLDVEKLGSLTEPTVPCLGSPAEPTGHPKDYATESLEEVETGTNSLEIIELQNEGTGSSRVIQNQRIPKPEATGGQGMKCAAGTGTETSVSRLVDGQPIGDVSTSSYNGSVSQELPDMSQTPEQTEALAFRDAGFCVTKDDPRIKAALAARKADSKKPIDEDREIQRELANKAKAIAKKNETPQIPKTVLEDPKVFIDTFRRIFREQNGTCSIPPGNPYPPEERNFQAVARDRLQTRARLDVDVMLGWMRFAADKFKTWRSVPLASKMMNATWEEYSKHMISTSAVSAKAAAAVRISGKKSEKPDIIGDAMTKYFASGIVPANTYRACEYWGVVLTAQYLATVTDVDTAIGSVEAALAGRRKDQLACVFEFTIKYEPHTDGMVLSNWRERFSDYVAKAGKMDVLPRQAVDADRCAAFVAGSRRVK